MCFSNKCMQFFFCSELRIDFIVIDRIIFVIRTSFKNRCQVKASNSQIRKVRKLFDDSGNIATHIVFTSGGAPPSNGLLGRQCIIAITKAFRENLIINLRCGPFRSPKAIRRIRPKKFKEAFVHASKTFIKSVSAIPDGFCTFFQFKAIADICGNAFHPDRCSIAISLIIS